MKVISETAYILAGGKSRRMGVDKLFLHAGKSTLLERTIKNSLKIFRGIKIVAPNHQRFGSFIVQGSKQIQMLLDSTQAEGPLAGIIASIDDSRTKGYDACFIVAADLFDFSSVDANRLLTEYNREQFLGISENGEPQPLCGIYNQSSFEQLVSYANRGKYGIKEMVSNLNHKLVEPSSEKWRNINHPSDLAGIGYKI